MAMLGGKPRLTFEELLALTTIVECPKCGLDHAPVRTCAEAQLEKELVHE